MQDAKQPNHRLRREREQRGWTREDMADQLFRLCKANPRGRGDINANMIGRWERGEHRPSLFWQKNLCELFGTSLEQLGFIAPLEHPLTSPVASAPVASVVGRGEASLAPSIAPLSTAEVAPGQSLRDQSPSPVVPQVIIVSPQTRAVDAIFAVREGLPAGLLQQQGIDNASVSAYAQYERERQLSEWLLLGAGCIAPLFDEGWSQNDVLQVIQILSKVVQAMPNMSRQQFLRGLLGFGAAAIVGSIPDLSMEKHVSADDRAKLHQALGDSIVAAWKFFPSTSNAQALAIGQTQLILIQQSEALLYPSVRPFLYTGVYGLIGLALHFQERDLEALQSHRSGYIAALGTGEPWYVAQSLICQSDCYHALGQMDSANQSIEEALRIIGNPRDEAQVCARAHLLTCWADNTMVLGDYKTAQEKLAAAGENIDHIMPNDEFDKASWHMITGKYGLLTKNYTAALHSFEESLSGLPEQWTVRRTMSTIGLAKAYAGLRERDKSLSVAENLLPMVQTLNAKMTNTWYADYLQQDLLGTFSADERTSRFVTDTQQRLPQLAGMTRRA